MSENFIIPGLIVIIVVIIVISCILDYTKAMNRSFDTSFMIELLYNYIPSTMSRTDSNSSGEIFTHVFYMPPYKWRSSKYRESKYDEMAQYIISNFRDKILDDHAETPYDRIGIRGCHITRSSGAKRLFVAEILYVIEQETIQRSEGGFRVPSYFQTMANADEITKKLFNKNISPAAVTPQLRQITITKGDHKYDR